MKKLILLIMLFVCGVCWGKECSKCKKQMIKRDDGNVLLSNPPQYPWTWWCGCGHTEKGGVRRGLTSDEIYERIWKSKQESDKLVKSSTITMYSMSKSTASIKCYLCKKTTIYNTMAIGEPEGFTNITFDYGLGKFKIIYDFHIKCVEDIFKHLAEFPKKVDWIMENTKKDVGCIMDKWYKGHEKRCIDRHKTWKQLYEENKK